MRYYEDRAASSLVLNLAEGRGCGTKADQRRFFHMAFGSVRECQAILDISPERGSLRPSRREPNADAIKLADVLAVNVYCLIRSFPLRSTFRLRSAFRLSSASRPKLWRDRLRPKAAAASDAVSGKLPADLSRLGSRRAEVWRLVKHLAARDGESRLQINTRRSEAEPRYV